MTTTTTTAQGGVPEQVREGFPGGVMLLLQFLVGIGAVALIVAGAMARQPLGIVAGALTILTNLVFLAGHIVVNPNEAKVLLLFGRYAGTVKRDGWYWVNPFYSKQRISLRTVNFETERLKVNDLDGNPIEIAAIVVWRVVDTAEASFAVADYSDYVRVQSESALRSLATHYSYDANDAGQVSLRSHIEVVAERLREELQKHLDKAGVEVQEARISHLAYAAEIAEAMLRRQQAGAIIAARKQIVDGAVGMVEMALERLASKKVVELGEDQKATMVSNLLVVLCSEQATHPVVNAGTLYQ
jgi:regulator of protease activity HflC (stomatin/prohibitin superfamily)